MCGHTGTTFALYKSDDLEHWDLLNNDLLPDKPGGGAAALYTPVLAYSAKRDYFVLMFQCSSGCADGEIQVATATTPEGPYVLRGALLPSTDVRHGTSTANLWVDESSGVGYLVFNSIGDDAARNGQWIVELDDTLLAMTNRSSQIVAAGHGSEGGWLEGGGIFQRGELYYYMTGSGCCYCAGGGGAMVFVATHPLGPWSFQTNINDGFYLPFSPKGPPPPPNSSKH